MHKAQTTTWDMAINIGVKCNLLPLSRKANIRYISSPFDNMDSVDGFKEIGDLIAARFESYFSVSSWLLRNDYPHNSTEIRAKIAWNKDYPGLYYPHFYHRWLKDISEDELAEWLKNPEGSLDFVWEGLSETYKRRQNRLLKILDERNSVLFVRLEDKASLRRILKQDVLADALSFESSIKRAYPNNEFSTAYFYFDKDDRHFESTDLTYFEKIPMDSDESYLVERLSQFHLQPRKQDVND